MRNQSLNIVGSHSVSGCRRVFERHDCELLCWMTFADLAQHLSPEELLMGSDMFINLISNTNADGKTTLYRTICNEAGKWDRRYCFLPEAKNRKARSGESYGIDLVYYPAVRTLQASIDQQFVVAYMVTTTHLDLDTGEEEVVGLRFGGITLSSFVRAIRKGCRKGIEYFMTIPPEAFVAFLTIFPLTRCIYVVAGTGEDFERFRARRRLDFPNKEVVPFGWSGCHPATLEGTITVVNEHVRLRKLVKQVESYLRRPRVYQVLGWK